jgi:hypothetical protein
MCTGLKMKAITRLTRAVFLHVEVSQTICATWTGAKMLLDGMWGSATPERLGSAAEKRNPEPEGRNVGASASIQRTGAAGECTVEHRFLMKNLFDKTL